MIKTHTFHIPVMGIGYTIDTPIKVAHYGIDSVISLVDDILIEQLRKYYSEKNEIPYKAITDNDEDFRAKRISAYLNMVNELVQKNFESFKNLNSTKCVKFNKFLNLLPDFSTVKIQLQKFVKENAQIEEVKKWIQQNLKPGSIDVNIMTKVDKTNYLNNEALPSIYNDAHAALRGFATSNLEASIVLSAGLNPKLFSYIENFKDFYPDVNGNIKKKIILKVSDYRLALIQGKFLAKKGLWVSEFRIESGLNCGGHAFATDGYLLGPVLEEFKNNKTALHQELQTMVYKVLESKTQTIPTIDLVLKITAQGGVGTAEEHDFLIKTYNLDTVGWGSPFLLVPEATTVDNNTLDLLVKAKEDDIYLSNISPLGIPFNNLRTNTRDVEKQQKIEDGKPGVACTKKFVMLNYEFSDKGLCLASRKYQAAKIKELDTLGLDEKAYDKAFKHITDKSCICVGLGTPALLSYNIERTTEGETTSVCPGPNLAYYDKVVDLEHMVGHIYGKNNLLEDTQRPHVFIKELQIYINYIQNQIKDLADNITDKNKTYFAKFLNNLEEGVNYYQKILTAPHLQFELKRYHCEINYLKSNVNS